MEEADEKKSTSRRRRKLMIRVRCLTLLVVVGLLPVCVPGQERATGAIVEKLSGSVILKQNGKETKLNARSDIGRDLHVGDIVSCQKDAKLTLRAGSRTLELDEYSGAYTIVAPDSPKFKKVVDAYGRTGGRDRGGFTVPILYAPANESSVVPDQFVLRWAPLKQSCVISLIVHDAKGQELWQQSKVDGAIGSLNSDALHQALIGYREKKPTAVLQLDLADTCGDEDRVTFSLLSLADEKSLKEELGGWAGEQDQLMVHLGRAAVFFEYQMFPETAEEYEAALALAPESQSLLKRTIDAERRIGNRARAKALASQLSRKE